MGTFLWATKEIPEADELTVGWLPCVFACYRFVRRTKLREHFYGAELWFFT